MPRWVILLVLMGVCLVPFAAHAQTPVALASLQVQLWPEYDQPSMLVIYDFQVAQGTELPLGVTIKFPKEANLIAVAVQGADGSLMNADYLESTGDETWQAVIVQIQSPLTYRIEYYQPLTRSGDQRQFSYQWSGDYAVQNFGIAVRLPGDATSVTTTPELGSATLGDAIPVLQKDFGALTRDQVFTFRLSYSRSSDTLAAPQSDLQPSRPLSGSTPGRVMLSNYLPYVLGALGFVLIAGGSVYFWQTSRGGRKRQQRHSRGSKSAVQGAEDVYCHQCGTRAQAGDRFCRVCGSRLRPPE